jgi:hypothetical protein
MTAKKKPAKRTVTPHVVYRIGLRCLCGRDEWLIPTGIVGMRCGFCHSVADGEKVRQAHNLGTGTLEIRDASVPLPSRGTR